MKIVMFAHNFLPKIGGLEIVTYESSKRLVEMGHNVKIITSTYGNCSIKEVIENIEIIRIPKLNFMEKFGVPYPIFSPIILKEARESIKWADIVHAHGHPYISSLVASKYSKKYNKPLVLSIHNSFIDYKNFFLNFLENLNDKFISSQTLKNTDIVISTCKYFDDYIKKINPKIESRIIYNGIDTQNFLGVNENEKEQIREKLNIPQNTFICLTVGRITYKKGIDNIVEIAKKIKEKDIIFYIVGNGPDYDLIKSLINKFNLEKKIIMMGYAEIYLLKLLYQVSDIFILPSRGGESLTLVIAEALSSNLPVIATKSGGVSEIIIEDKNGYLVEIDDINSIIEKIYLLYNDKDLREKLGINGRKYVEDNYSWEKYMNSTLSIYEKLIQIK
ncbi:MAG TPA: glycosyltransferase family 4 protein [Methanofastidiosum sp.]|nr:glycosyltransferase family 4 protein [Methanofastidiosum sp.]